MSTAARAVGVPAAVVDTTIAILAAVVTRLHGLGGALLLGPDRAERNAWDALCTDRARRQDWESLREQPFTQLGQRTREQPRHVHLRDADLAGDL